MNTTNLTREQYLSTYLQQSEVPQMRNVQDMRFASPRPDDANFAANGGLGMGRMIWVGPDDDVLWQIMDIRFAFPDAARAVTYHRAQLGVNAEGSQPVRGAPPVGSYCAVFGGIRPNPIDPTLTVTHYYYLFVIDCILVKLFAAQAPQLAPGTLTPEQLTPVARAAEQRVAAALTAQLWDATAAAHVDQSQRRS